jgi:dTDP-4-dehydrorhamnose reductase
MRNVLLLGHSGQLASELRLTVPASIKLRVIRHSEFCRLSYDELSLIFLSYKPDWVINAVGFNSVDQAELEPALALTGNFSLVQKLHQLCTITQSRLLHISTDFVFEGERLLPYKELDKVNPINEYGKSKVLAEQWLVQEYAESCLIIRTSWLYSVYGSNFVKTMLNLMQTKEQLSVVQDQNGSPCWAAGLANVIWLIIRSNLVSSGIYHWADSGYCSKYEFALEIQAVALKLGLLTHKAEIKAADIRVFDKAAPRPAFSALDSTLLKESLCLPDLSWQHQLFQALSLFKPVCSSKKE